MSVAETIPWKPGHLFTNGTDNIYLAPVAIMFEPRYRQAQYMAVTQVTDEILERLCKAGVDGNYGAC